MTDKVPARNRNKILAVGGEGQALEGTSNYAAPSSSAHIDRHAGRSPARSFKRASPDGRATARELVGAPVEMAGGTREAPEARNTATTVADPAHDVVNAMPAKANVACPHLGLDADPFRHRDAPSPEHRCYLWMQRDRIDVAHQDMFCLSSQHARCPWLAISAPSRAKALKGPSLTEKLTARFEDVDVPWQRLTLAVAAAVVQGSIAFWHFAQPILLQLGVLLLALLKVLGTLLLRPFIWLSHNYRSIERAIWGATFGRLFNRSGATHSGDLSEGGSLAPSDVDPEQIAAGQLFLQRGMEAMRDGNNEAALRRFRLATGANPADEQAWLMRAAVAVMPEEKTECFKKVLVLNPLSERARVGLQELGGLIAPRAGIATAKVAEGSPTAAASAGNLVEAGLEAMKQGNEELAYHYFGLATGQEPDNEQAWYWRAKTAPTLDEVVQCLQRITVINPYNAKAQADLLWAMQRQQREQQATQQPQAAPTKREGPSLRTKVVASLRQASLQVSALSSFLVGLAMALPYAIDLTDLPAAADFQPYLRLLPDFRTPPILLPDGAAGGFDIGAALPLVLGILLLHAAFRLSDGGGLGTRIWAALLAAGALVLMVKFVPNSPAWYAGAALALVALILALAGEAPESERSVVTFG